MAEVQDHTAELGGSTVHWVTAGAGEPLLLLHGWPQTWYEWRRVIDLVPDRWVIAPDLRGWGGSSRPAQGFDLRTVAGEIALLADHLGLADLDVVGHDWGAPVGYMLAAQRRVLVRSLALLDASIPGAGGERLLDFSAGWSPLWFFPFLATPELAYTLVAGSEREFFGWILDQMARNTPGAIGPRDREVYLDAYADAEAVRTTCAYYATVWESAQQVVAAKAEPLTVPVLAVGGGRSLGAKMLDFARELAPDPAGVVLADCGHLVPEERPQELVDALRAFWSGNAAGAG